MRKGRTTSVVEKNKSATNITHVLLQTNEGLVLGTTDQVKSSGKENLKVGMTTTLINGRKRTPGTIVCLGTSAQCEQSRKTISHSSSKSADQTISSSKSVDENQKNSQLLTKDNQQRLDQKSISIMPSRKSKVVHDQQQNTAKKLIPTNTKLLKTHHDVVQAGTTREHTKEAALAMDEGHHIEKSVHKHKKANKRKEFEEEEQLIAKKIPHKKSTIEISQEAVGTSSTISKNSGMISDGTDGEEEAALVIDESRYNVEPVQKHSKTKKRKEFEEEEQLIAKKIPHKKSTIEISQEAVGTSSTISKNSGMISDGTDGEEEVALVIDESRYNVEPVQKHSKTNKRKDFGEKEQVEAKRNSLNKTSNESAREDLEVPLMTSKPVKKKGQSKQTTASSTRETEFLKNQLERIHRETVALPTGDAAIFILNLADRIRSKGTGNDLMGIEQTMFIGDRLADISDLLGLTDADLELVRHPTNITKTVRQVTKMIYPNINDRRKMKISTMEEKIIKAIIDYARITHPFAPENIDLRGHIGNVFATDRRSSGYCGEAQHSTFTKEDDESNDEETNESNEEDDE